MTQDGKKRVWLSWSSGKDSAFTLYTLRQSDDVEVVGLLTTINQAADRVAMHAVRAELLRQQAEVAKVPVYEVMLPHPCSNDDYKQRMTDAVEAARAAGAQAVAFGDLFLQDVRAYREKNMEGTGIGTLFPLWDSWGKDTAALARRMCDIGLRAVLTCVDPKKLPASFAGRQFDRQLLEDLPEGVDPCGENGEFHTFVYDGPMFSQPIAIRVGAVIERDGFVFCDVLPADAPEGAEAAAVAAAAALAPASGETCVPPSGDAGVEKST